MYCRTDSQKHVLKFCRTFRPLLSDKSKSNEKITSVENRKFIYHDKENMELLNSVFSDALKNLKTPELCNIILQSENVSHPIFNIETTEVQLSFKNTRCGSGFYFYETYVNDI